MAKASPGAVSFLLVGLAINLKECAPALLAAPWKPFSVFVSRLLAGLWTRRYVYGNRPLADAAGSLMDVPTPRSRQVTLWLCLPGLEVVK